MISNESVYTILTEKRDYAKVIRARVCVYRARVLDTASRNASSRVSRSNILETRSKRARKKTYSFRWTVLYMFSIAKSVVKIAVFRMGV